MRLNEKLVQVAPKLLVWYGLPMTISEEQRFGLLMRDISLHELDPSTVSAIPELNGKTSAFIIPYDRYIKQFRTSEVTVAQELCRFLTSHAPHNSLVYGRQISSPAVDIFDQLDVSFIQTDLSYEAQFWQFLKNHALPLFHKAERPSRRFIRVIPREFDTFRVFVKILGKPIDAPLTGSLVNLSMNGLSIKIGDRRLANLQLRDSVQITMRSPKNVIRIDCGFVSRIDRSSDHLAVAFRLDDASFVQSRDSQQLKRMILMTLDHAVKQKATADTAHKDLSHVSLALK